MIPVVRLAGFVRVAVLLALAGVSGPSSVLSRTGAQAEEAVFVASAARVTGVAVTSSAGSDQTYGALDTIEFTLTFDENVTVDTEDGNPSIGFTIGPARETAAYAGGSGTRQLVFRYSVDSGPPRDIAAYLLGNTNRGFRHGGDDADGVSVEAGSIRLNGGLITNSSGRRANLDHPALGPQSHHKVDRSRPVLERRPAVNGDTMELVFSETLDRTDPSAGAFTVKVDGAARTVSSTSVSGGTVSLTLAPAVGAGDPVSVECYDSNVTCLKDPQGNPAFPIWPTAVFNATPETSVSDPQGPGVSSLALNSDPGSDGVYGGGDTIELAVTFDDNVTVDTANGTPSLDLTIGKAVRTASYTGGSGTATLTFSYTVARGYPPRFADFDNFHYAIATPSGDEDADGVSVGAGRIRLNGATIRNATDADARLDHQGLAAQSGHRVDGTVPTVDGRPVANGNTLTFSYVEALDASSSVDAADFAVVGRNSRAWSVSNARLSGSTVTLTLGSPLAHNDGVWLRYQPGGTPVRDVAGNGGRPLLDIFVANETPEPAHLIDPAAATIDSIVVGSDAGADRTYASGDGIDIVLHYDGNVTVDTANGTPSIEFEVGRSRRTAVYASGSGSALTFRYRVVAGLPPGVVFFLRLLGYDAPPAGDEDEDGVRVPAGYVSLNGGVIEDAGGRAANVPHPKLAAQSDHLVDGVQPSLKPVEEGAVDGSSIRVAYTEALDDAALNRHGFKVLVGGVERGVSGASVDGADVTLTLDSPVEDSDQVVLGYQTGVVAVRDRVGNAAYDETIEVQAGGGPNRPGGPGGPGGPTPDPDPDPDPDPEPPPPPPPPSVSVSDAQASESAGAVVFDVRLSRTSGSVVTVDYATSDGAGDGGAKAGTDYTATAGTLTFASGSQAEQIRVPVTDDGRYEAAPETFTLTLRRPVNATLAGGGSELRVTGTIHDDDDGPPMAAFQVVGAACDEELCRARTGVPVEFLDTSTGKVLSRRWDFGDGRASSSLRPAHSWSEPGFYEVTLEVGDGETISTASRKFLVEAAEPAGTCVADDETRCLGDSRFAVTADWRAGDDRTGPGYVVPEGTNDSALFYFFEPGDNWEVLIKVLDGCSVNEHVWVYGASATTLGYAVQVTDTVTGAVKEYRNEPGTAAAAITDVTAFPDACRVD